MTKAFRICFLFTGNFSFWWSHAPKYTPILLATPRKELELYPNLWIIGQAKFPELETDILSCICSCAIFSYQHSVRCMLTLLFMHFYFTERQHPATRQWASFRLLY